MANSNSNNSSPTNSSNTSSGNEKCLTIGEVEKLFYEIHRYSSFLTNYFPENILVDSPCDQTSRWSAQTNTPPQFLTLKLRRPAIVKYIKFGKFHKDHVCNLKKFKVYGGLDEDCLTLILEAGLKNDHVPETFELRHVTEDGSENLPILYLKIVPILSWGAAFNFTIWYVELHGVDDPMVTNASMKNYNILREMEVVRLCLKHFRQQGYIGAFKALQEQTQVQLEHPIITDLHKCLVLQGDFEKAEKYINDWVNDGLMDSYLHRQPYNYRWTLKDSSDGIQPGFRGGHQLVLHSQRRQIYLYGGWDGFRDLSDLWIYDIPSNTWKMVFEKSEDFNGPSPRSCHKMVFDPVTENIFMIGRYLDNSIRTTDYIKSDFFLYDTKAQKWMRICADTSQVNGPQLVYDHQMCIDIEKRTIYVFGGKVLTPRSVNNSNATCEPEFSGLYSYHIDTNTWTNLLVDCHHPSASQPDVQSIKSRITHCMVFHSKQRKLYIYGGQRGKEDLDEFLTYDVDSQILSAIDRNFHNNVIVHNIHDNSSNGTIVSNTDFQYDTKTEPSPGYTLRASIDCDRDEIYVFSSLCKMKDRRENQLVDPSNSFWVYSLHTHKWTLIYSHRSMLNESTNANVPNKSSFVEPCPRYAHQMVYDDQEKIHYLFGGNPGKTTQPQLRLDDFWTLLLQKPKREEVLRNCCFLIRKLHYEEMARSDPFKAMAFLRNQISDVIDHTDSEQLNTFHRLASLLFKPDDVLNERSAVSTPPLGMTPFIEAVEQMNNANQQMTDIKLPKSFTEEDYTQKSDSLAPNDDYSIESCENSSNTTASSATDISTDLLTSSYNQYIKAGGKRPRHDYLYNIRSRRSYLFNKLVQLMPNTMVQPERNLSDFVVM